MTAISKISVAVTREQLKKIKAAIKRGDYASTSEVIRTALREWEANEEFRRREAGRLGRFWDEGIASGKPVDGVTVMARLRDKYSRLERAQASKKRSKRAA